MHPLASRPTISRESEAERPGNHTGPTNSTVEFVPLARVQWIAQGAVKIIKAFILVVLGVNRAWVIITFASLADAIALGVVVVLVGDHIAVGCSQNTNGSTPSSRQRMLWLARTMLLP